MITGRTEQKDCKILCYLKASDYDSEKCLRQIAYILSRNGQHLGVQLVRNDLIIRGELILEFEPSLIVNEIDFRLPFPNRFL